MGCLDIPQSFGLLQQVGIGFPFQIKEGFKFDSAVKDGGMGEEHLLWQLCDRRALIHFVQDGIICPIHRLKRLKKCM